jgi:ABC-type glycerol-3-phosphate transport system permease component
MTVPIYVVSLVISLAMGYNADRTNQKAWHIFAATILGAASFIVTAIVTKASVRYAFICFGGAGIWTAVPLFLSWMVGNFEGREKRAVSIAMINGFGGCRPWSKLLVPTHLLTCLSPLSSQATWLRFTGPSSGPNRTPPCTDPDLPPRPP